MIERYALEKMSRVWEDEFKFRTMLTIEILALEALAKQRKVPPAAVQRIRKKATFRIEKIKAIEEKTHHDIVAFVNCVSQSIGKDAQYLHRGLTSSDLLDTTLGVQLRAASDILLDDLKRLLTVLAKKARKYRDMVCVGRTHGIHAEPTTLGLKLALWYDETKRNIQRLQEAQKAVSVGKVSGAVGTFSHNGPEVEEYICRKLGLKPAPISTQVIQRDIYAEYVCTLAVVAARTIATKYGIYRRQRCARWKSPLPRGRRGLRRCRINAIPLSVSGSAG